MPEHAPVTTAQGAVVGITGAAVVISDVRGGVDPDVEITGRAGSPEDRQCVCADDQEPYVVGDECAQQIAKVLRESCLPASHAASIARRSTERRVERDLQWRDPPTTRRPCARARRRPRFRHERSAKSLAPTVPYGRARSRPAYDYFCPVRAAPGKTPGQPGRALLVELDDLHLTGEGLEAELAEGALVEVLVDDAEGAVFFLSEDVHRMDLGQLLGAVAPPGLDGFESSAASSAAARRAYYAPDESRPR